MHSHEREVPSSGPSGRSRSAQSSSAINQPFGARWAMPLGREPRGSRNKSYDSVRHEHCFQTLIYAEYSGLDVDFSRPERSSVLHTLADIISELVAASLVPWGGLERLHRVVSPWKGRVSSFWTGGERRVRGARAHDSQDAVAARG